MHFFLLIWNAFQYWNEVVLRPIRLQDSLYNCYLQLIVLSNLVDCKLPRRLEKSGGRIRCCVIFEQEARMAMAVKLFEMKRLSSGMAAQLAGIDRVSFLMSLAQYNVPMQDLTVEELGSDFANA